MPCKVNIFFLLVYILLFDYGYTNSLSTDSLLNSQIPEQGLNLVIKNLLSNFGSCEFVIVEDSQNSEGHWSIIVDSSRLNIRLDLYNSSIFFINPRHFSQCSIIITFLFYELAYLPHFGKLLTERFRGPTKRDEDYYVFITHERDAQSVLNSSTGQTIKYKLVLPFKLKAPMGFSICFFCGLQGTSKLVPIDLANVTLLTDLFPDFTRNGNGYKMRTTSPIKYKFTTEIVREDDGWRLVRGISKSILDGLLPHYNFSYYVFSSPSGDTGSPDKNGSWNGCVGQILSGEADLALTTSANHARFLKIGFSTAAFYVWVSFTTGKPKVTYSWKAILEPFKKEFWGCLITSVLVVILVFKFFEKFDNQSSNGKRSLYRDIVIQVTFSLVGKNVPEPEANFSRILLSLWLLAALVISTLYNSKIVSLLAIPVYDNPPNTFEELANLRNYEWGMDISGGSLYALFQSSSSPIFQKLFRQLQKPQETVNCFQKALESNFACITWAGVADYVSWRNFTLVDGRSPLLRATDITSFLPCGLAMERNAVFKSNFDKTISIIFDTGHGNRWIMDDLEELQRKYLKWQTKDMNRTIVRHGELGPIMLKLRNIVGVFYVYCIGHGLGMLGFIGEGIWYFSANFRTTERVEPLIT